MQNFTELTNRLTNRQFAIRIIILLALMFAGNIIFLLIANVFSLIFWDFNFFQTPDLLSNSSNPEVISILRFFQGTTSVGMFLVPGLVWSWIYEKPINKSLDLKPSVKSSSVLTMLALIIAALPMINALAAMNQALDLPSWLQELENSLKATEASAMKFMEALLSTESISILIANLIVVAVLPAVAEEVVFRGIIQKEILRLSGKPILSIIIAALLFSAMHMQFYTFLPRFALGIMLGLVFYWSKNLWVPIALHFLNNSLSVLVWYWLPQEEIENTLENVGTTSNMWPLAIVSILFVVAILYYFKKSLAHNLR